MKRSFINISSGAIGYILPIILNIFFTPVIIHTLGSEAYGLQSLVNVIIGYLMVADMGLDIPITRFVAQYNVQKEYFLLNKLLNSSLQIYLLIGTLGALIICCLTPLLVDSLFKVPVSLREDAINVFFLAGLGFTGSLFSMWGKSIFNGLLRYEISNGISVVTNLISLVVGISLVMMGFGVVYYVLARVLAIFFSGIIYVIMVKNLVPDLKFSFGIDKNVWDQLKNQIGYGFFLRISGILTSRLDQTLIGMWIGVAAVGMYSIPILIITSLTGLIGSMTHYIFPRMSELNVVGSKRELEKLFYQASRYIGILTFLIFTPFIFLGKSFLNVWVGNEVADNVASVFFLLLIGSIISTLSSMLINAYLPAIGRLNVLTRYIFLRGVVIGLSCTVLLKIIGLNGAGWALIIGSFCDVVFYLITINSVKINVSYIYKKIYLKLAVISLIIMPIMYYLFEGRVNSWFDLVFSGVGYLTLFIISTFVFRVYNDEEIAMLKKLKERFLKRFC